MSRWGRGLLAVVFFVACRSSVAAQDFSGGFKIGLLTGGTVTIANTGYGDFDFGTNAGLAYEAYGDYRVAPRLSMVAHLGWWTFPADYWEDGSETMLDVGGGLKAIIPIENTAVVIRPGFGLGYGTMSISGMDDGTFFLVRAYAETVYRRAGNRIGYVGELGFLSAPSGGNDRASVTTGPILYLRGGVEF